MKFSIRKEELEMALKVIKDSKALSKINDDIGTSSIMIEVDSENKVLTLTSTNYHVWCIAKLDSSVFADYDAELSTFFNMEESGEVFVDGFDFINVISGYPQDSLIHFSTSQKNGDVETRYLEGVVETKRGKKIKNSFMTRTPEFFQKDPPVEERQVHTVPAKALYEAVNAVEFVSGTEDGHKHLWGVQIEIYEDEIAAMATDKKRICYYDIRGENRSDLDKGVHCVPIKLPLTSALKNLRMADTIDIHVGQKKTVLKQGWQTHVLPNVTFSNQKLPDWREFAKKLNSDESRVNINLPKKSIDGCVKRAMLSSGGYYGIKIVVDTDSKQVEFSIQKVEESGIIQSKYSETEPLEEEQFSGRMVETVVLTTDNLKDIISKSKSDTITFRIKDAASPMQIMNNEDHFGYIASTVKYS